MDARKFYSIQEIMGALVYDSEGLYYGYLCNVEPVLDIKMYICIDFNVNDIVPDKEKLVELLRSRGLSASGEETLEYLIYRAREEGIDIPKKRVNKNVSMVKGVITIDDIQLIDDFIDYSTRERRILILLDKPKEAMYRGIPISKNPPLLTLENIKDKYVVSLSRGFLGIAIEVVVGAKELGIRIKKKGNITGYISWLAFLNTLKKKGYIELYNKLSEYIDPYATPRIELKMLDQILEFFKEASIPKEVSDLIKKYIIVEETGSMYEDIPLSNILKIRDIIIVK